MPVRRRHPAPLAGALAAAALLAGCASSGPARDRLLEQRVPHSVTVQARDVPGLGRILVDGHGRTLYLFTPDAGGRVSCTGPCVGVWPTLAVASAHRAHVGHGILGDDLSTLPDPNTGVRVVTYAGYPLYYYSGDLAAGQTNGQALYNNGGAWYVVSPNGDPITTVAGS